MLVTVNMFFWSSVCFTVYVCWNMPRSKEIRKERFLFAIRFSVWQTNHSQLLIVVLFEPLGTRYFLIILWAFSSCDCCRCLGHQPVRSNLKWYYDASNLSFSQLFEIYTYDIHLLSTCLLIAVVFHRFNCRMIIAYINIFRYIRYLLHAKLEPL